MKKNLLLLLVLLATVAVSASLGYHAGSLRRYTWIKSDFIGIFTALESLRSGDATAAIERLEAKCFSLANEIYGSPELRSDSMPQMFLKNLRDYRATYRTNTARSGSLSLRG